MALLNNFLNYSQINKLITKVVHGTREREEKNEMILFGGVRLECQRQRSDTEKDIFII